MGAAFDVLSIVDTAMVAQPRKVVITRIVVRGIKAAEISPLRDRLRIVVLMREQRQRSYTT